MAQDLLTLPQAVTQQLKLPAQPKPRSSGQQTTAPTSAPTQTTTKSNYGVWDTIKNIGHHPLAFAAEGYTGVLAADYQEDKMKAEFKQVQTQTQKNPNQFSAPKMRFAALAYRADSIKKDPKYQALSQQNKDAVWGDYYDRYVVPGYKQLGYTPPSKELYIRGVQKDSNTLDPRTFLGTPAEMFEQYVSSGLGVEASKILKGMSYAGVNLTTKAAADMLKLNRFFHIPLVSEFGDVDIPQGVTNKQIDQSRESLVAKAHGTINNINHTISDRDYYWNATHPTKSLINHLASGVGEAVVLLPFYSSIDGAIEKGGAAGLKALDTTPGLGKVANLTNTLMETKIGQVVAKRIGEAMSGYIGAVSQNQNQSEAVSNAVGFMLWGTLFAGAEVSGKGISNASGRLMRETAAKLGFLGGKQLLDTLGDSAAHELENDIIATDAEGNPIKLDMSQPKAVIQSAAENAVQAHLKSDPIHAQLMLHQKLTYSQIGRERFNKPWRNLSQAQRRGIRAEVDEINRKALQELPAHVPEASLGEAKAELDARSQKDPAFGQRKAELDQLLAKLGDNGKVEGAVSESEINQVMDQSGIRNTDGVMNHLHEVDLAEEEDLAHERELQPRKFAQFKVNTLAYLKNIAKGKSNKDLTAFLQGMSPEDFKQEILDQMGHSRNALAKTGYHFESYEHALLWANKFRNDIPKPIAKKVAEELHDMNPMETQKDWDRKSANLSAHMAQLAHTGHLKAEGNIFRSSLFNKWTQRTGWQHQLDDEMLQAEFKKWQKTFANYPEAQESAMNLLRQLQQLRFTESDPEKYEKAISDIEESRKMMRDAARRAKHMAKEPELKYIQRVGKKVKTYHKEVIKSTGEAEIGGQSNE